MCTIAKIIISKDRDQINPKNKSQQNIDKYPSI